MAVTVDVAPPIVFLVAYLFYFVVLLLFYAKGTIRWRSRYSFIMFHVVLRLAGMACGIAFSVLTWEDNEDVKKNVLIAYLVFSAEGYFSLIVCAYRFLIVWQEDRFGASPLEPRIPKGTSFRRRWRMHARAPIALLHWGLISANALIIAGSSIMAGAIGEEGKQNDITTGKGLRVAGTAVFLSLAQVFLLLCVKSFRRQGDRTLALITVLWVFLTVRGVYGIISVVLPAYSYSSSEAYTQDGFTSTFLIGEHVMGSLMEWLAAGFLIATHYSSVVGGAELVEEPISDASRDEEALVEMRK
ncbi:hypothetical protein JCM6882_005189 [Rhodosporidiobolus microsporus]